MISGMLLAIVNKVVAERKFLAKTPKKIRRIAIATSNPAYWVQALWEDRFPVTG